MSTREREKRKVQSARKRAESHTSGFSSKAVRIPDGVKLFKLKAGTMLIDILPYAAGEGNPYADPGVLHYERTFFTHRGIGAGNDSFVCARKTAGKRCPVCEYRQNVAKDPDADESVIKGMAPKERQLFNVIDRKNKEAGVQIWELSFHLFGKLLDSRINSESGEGEGWDTFHDLEDGKSLVLTVAEKKFEGNDFCEVTAIDFKDRPKPYDESMLEKVHCLDELLIIEKYDKMKSIVLQTDDEEDKSDDDDKPKKKKAVADDDDDADEKPAKKKAASDDDDDDDDEKPAKKKAAASDDDDDEPQPKKKKPSALDDDDDDEKPAKKKPAADDDDEPEEKPKKKKPVDDDDDADEKPAKKKSKGDEDDDDDFADDDDDDKPKKKKAVADDDDDADDEDKAADADDDADEKPSKKKSKGDEDDDD